MKIDIITQTFYPYEGIDTTWFMEMSKNLARRGHDVMVHTTPYLLTGFDKLPADDYIGGVKVRIYRLYPGYIFFPRVRDCDLVHLFSFGPLYYLMQSFLQSKNNLVTSPNAEEVASYNKLRNRMFGRFLLNQSKKIIAITYHEATFLKDKYRIKKEKIVVIANSILSTDSFKEPSSNFPEKDLIKNLIVNKYFTRVARIVPFKEIEFGIELVSKLDNLNFVVVGPIEDNAYYEKLKQYALNLNVADRVIFIGSVSFDAKISILRSAQFYLFNNREGFGIATLEAMAQGLPVLGLDYDAYNDFLDDSNSLRFKTLDEAVDKANVLIRDREMAQSLGKSGMMKVKKEFCFEHLVDQIERTYKEVLGL